jgi:hypothetical protein
MKLNVRRGDADSSTINLLEGSMPNDDGSIGRYLAALAGGTKYPGLEGLASVPTSYVKGGVKPGHCGRAK